MSGRFVAFVMIAGLLAGCGGSVGDRPHTGPVSSVPTADPTTSVTHSAPPSPARPTIPADVPRTGSNLKYKGEQPPVMPVAATQHTQAGAVAFAEFFIKTIDWGYATTNSAYMRHYMRDSCVACVSLAKAIDTAAAMERHFIGDRISVRPGETVASRRTTVDFSVRLSIAVESGEVVDRAGNFVDGAPALRQRISLDLSWVAAWSVVTWSPVT